MSEADAKRPPPGGLTLTEVGRISAYLGYFPQDKKREVLTRFGLTACQWEEAVDAWTHAMAKEVLEGHDDLSRSVAKVLAETMAELNAEQPALEALGNEAEARVQGEKNGTGAGTSG